MEPARRPVLVNNDGGRPKFSLRFNKSVSGDNASPAASSHHRLVPDQPGDRLRHQFEGIDAFSSSYPTLVKSGPRRMEDANCELDEEVQDDRGAYRGSHPRPPAARVHPGQHLFLGKRKSRANSLRGEMTSGNFFTVVSGTLSPTMMSTIGNNTSTCCFPPQP